MRVIPQLLCRANPRCPKFNDLDSAFLSHGFYKKRMNISTFRDAVQSKKASLANELEEEEEGEEEEKEVRVLARDVEGEEEEGAEKFNEVGEVIEPFNLRNEREGGYFDENMNYVFKKEQGEIDAWIAGLDESTVEASIGEAALAEKKRLAKLAEKDAEEEAKPQLTPIQLKKELLGLMQPNETISAALRHLSGKADPSKGSIKRRRAGDKASSSNEPKLSAAEQRKQQLQVAKQNRPLIERVTEIADLLIAGGLTGIYDMTYEAIAASTVQWEYKGADDIVYGPYTSQEIAGWKEQGYLTGATAVLMRQARQRPKSLLSSQNKVVDSIYDDHDVLEDKDDERAAKRQKIDENEGVRVVEQKGGGEDDDGWLNSDEIDFGVYSNLDQEALVDDNEGVIEDEEEESKTNKGSRKGVTVADVDSDNDD